MFFASFLSAQYCIALQYNPVITFIYRVALVYRHNRYARAQQHIQGKGAEQK